MNPTVAVLLAVAALGIIIAAVVELSKYFRGQSIISRQQLILRLIMAVLLLAIVGLSLWGMVCFQANPQPLTVAVFGFALVLLVVVVMVLAVVDLRQVRATQHRARAELYQRLAELRRELAELAETKQTEDETEQPPESQR